MQAKNRNTYFHSRPKISTSFVPFSTILQLCTSHNSPLFAWLLEPYIIVSTTEFSCLPSQSCPKGLRIQLLEVCNNLYPKWKDFSTFPFQSKWRFFFATLYQLYNLHNYHIHKCKPLCFSFCKCTFKICCCNKHQWFTICLLH
jgi:hypothetical protein